VQQTSGQVPFNTARADATPFQSMKEAIKYNKESKSGYNRRELQLLTLKPYEHDAFEWCEKHLPVLGKISLLLVSY